MISQKLKKTAVDNGLVISLTIGPSSDHAFISNASGKSLVSVFGVDKSSLEEALEKAIAIENARRQREEEDQELI